MILQVYREFYPEGSGVARHMDGLMQALATSGTAGAIFAPDVAPMAAARPFPVLTGGIRALWRAIGRADLVHVHGARTPIAGLAALLAQARGKPIVYTPHCYYDSKTKIKVLAKRLWDGTVERWLLRTAVAVVLLDPVWTTELAARGLTPRKTLYLPNCVLRASLDARRRPRQPATGGRPMLLSVGRLDPVKRLQDALALLTQPGLEQAELHLVGSGGDAARLQGIAETLGVAGRVHWHGPLPDTQVADLLAQADVFLLLSEREGGPTALLEALWLGVPVIAARASGTVAVADALGWAGLVPVGDVAAAARAVLAPPPVTPELQARLAQVFTWEARVLDLLAVYRTAR